MKRSTAALALVDIPPVARLSRKRMNFSCRADCVAHCVNTQCDDNRAPQARRGGSIPSLKYIIDMYSAYLLTSG